MVLSPGTFDPYLETFLVVTTRGEKGRQMCYWYLLNRSQNTLPVMHMTIPHGEALPKNVKGALIWGECGFTSTVAGRDKEPGETGQRKVLERETVLQGSWYELSQLQSCLGHLFYQLPLFLGVGAY